MRTVLLLFLSLFLEDAALSSQTYPFACENSALEILCKKYGGSCSMRHCYDLTLPKVDWQPVVENVRAECTRSKGEWSACAGFGLCDPLESRRETANCKQGCVCPKGYCWVFESGEFRREVSPTYPNSESAKEQAKSVGKGTCIKSPPWHHKFNESVRTKRTDLK